MSTQSRRLEGDFLTDLESIFLRPTVSGMAQLLENTSGETRKEQSIAGLFQEVAAMSSREIASSLAEKLGFG